MNDTERRGLSDSNYQRLQALLEVEAGLKLKAEKRAMVESRLTRLVRGLNIGSVEEFCERLFSLGANSGLVVPLIDAMTTNKTEFLREPNAFDYLRSTVLPELEAKSAADGYRDIHLWSAACSSGEEPYTLAITVAEYNRTQAGRAMRFNVLATDISTNMLKAARNAVYTQEAISLLPEDHRKRYFLRGKDGKTSSYRVVPELRERIRTQRLNLVQPYSISPGVDVAFCRNVLIYFRREIQADVMRRICANIRPGGYLFMGHAEPLHGMDLPLEAIEPLTYRKTG